MYQDVFSELADGPVVHLAHYLHATVQNTCDPVTYSGFDTLPVMWRVSIPKSQSPPCDDGWLPTGCGVVSGDQLCR